MDLIGVGFFVFLLTFSSCYAQRCDKCVVTLNKQQYPIPQAMSLRSFIYYYGSPETMMSELYYVTINPKPFEPYYNYRLNYTALDNGVIYEQITADELGLIGNVTPECIQRNTALVPIIMDKFKPEVEYTANFERYPEGSSVSSEMQTFWSSCPSKYVWTMKCRGWRYGQTECPLENLFLELSIPRVGQNAPDNIPWSPILRDLSKANILFGADDLYWAYTYGESTLCTLR